MRVLVLGKEFKFPKFPDNGNGLIHLTIIGKMLEAFLIKLTTTTGLSEIKDIDVQTRLKFG